MSSSRPVARDFQVDLSRLGKRDITGMVGGLLLAISVFLPAFQVDAGNPNASIDGATGGVSCWEAFPILRFLLLLAAIAPFILAWIVVRGHRLEWARGEMTAVVAIAAIGLIFFNGIISRPGDPQSAIALGIGWFGMMVGAILMLVGATLRQGETQRGRKPPGTI